MTKIGKLDYGLPQKIKRRTWQQSLLLFRINLKAYLRRHTFMASKNASALF